LKELDLSVYLSEIVLALGGDLRGEDRCIDRLAPIESSTPNDLVFISHPRFAKQLKLTKAEALILPPVLADQMMDRCSCIVTQDVYYYVARLTQWWRRRFEPATAPFVHPSACIHPDAQLAPDVRIGPFVVVEANAVIGAACQLDAHVVVERGAVIGAGTHLRARVTIGARCVVGSRCLFHSGVVIGADGFGFAPHQGTWVKIEQLGAVQIGDDVELGANTCIDRGALGDTKIGNGVKLDNLVQIAHNVHIGDHTAMAGCVGVAGSAVIGAHCTVGGGAVVLGHLTLADHVHVSAASVVTRSLLKPGQYTGVFPLDDNAAWEKNAATLKQLHALRERIKQLEKS
jgi:UDP-3-O-[3-hydroxymyristoyl] glucosamine N-acyltransferase